MGLSFTIDDGTRKRSHSQVRVPRYSWPHFTVSGSRLPQPAGPGPRIYIPQEQGRPIMPPSTEFPFLRLLRIAGLRWRFSNPPPHWIAAPVFTSVLYGVEWSVSRSCLFNPPSRGKSPYWIRDWVGPRVGLDALRLACTGYLVIQSII
jgi:hypothetical protein